MLMASKILIYDRIVENGQANPVQLYNPRFEGEARNDWRVNPIGSTEWSISGGVATYIYAGSATMFYQTFKSGMSPDVYYNVAFNVTLTQGQLNVALSYDVIAEIQSSGSYSFSYIATGGTIPDQIQFMPKQLAGNWFAGSIDNVYITQDVVLSPVLTNIRYEPKAYLDMIADEPIGITYQIADVRELSKRFGAYSKTFKLPATSNNKEIFGHLHTEGFIPMIFDPRNKTKAQIISDDVVVYDGLLTLKNVNRVDEQYEYEIDFFDGSFAFIDAIKGKKLSDLNFSEFLHKLTKDEIVATWNETRSWRKGFYYPLLLNLSEKYVVSDFSPAIFKRLILDKIITSAGYTYELSPDVETMLDRMLLTPIGSRPNIYSKDVDGQSIFVGTDREPTFQIIPSGIGEAERGFQAVEMNLDSGVYSDPANLFDPSTYTFSAPFKAKYNIAFAVSARTIIDSLTAYSFATSGVYPTSTTDSYFAVSLVDQNGATIVISQQVPFPSSFGGGVYNGSENFVFSGDAELNIGQKYKLEAYMYNRAVYFNTTLGFGEQTAYSRMEIIADGTTLSITPYAQNEVTEGMTVKLDDWIPNATQEQFISDLFKIFNLYIIPDRENDKKLFITSRNEIYDTEYVIDRSDKVDINSDILYEFLTEISSSKTQFNYKKADDEYNLKYGQISKGLEYGEKTFDYGTDLYNETSNVRLQLYSPTPIVRDAASRYVPAVLVNQKKADIKLLYLGTERYDTNLIIDHYDTTSGSVQQYISSYYIPNLHIDSVTGSTVDINYGEVEKTLTDVRMNISSNNLFNQFYLDQLNNNKTARMISCMMRLNANEVREHIENIGARIWIEELNNYFILNSIVDFDPVQGDRQLTKVHLLEYPVNEGRKKHKAFSWVNGGLVSKNPFISSDPFNNDYRNINIGDFNFIGGDYNSVVGYGNNIYYNSTGNTVNGQNNTVNGGVNNVQIFGNNVTATTSNTTYFNNYATIGPTNTNFYNTTNITATGITTNAITINGVSFSGLPSGNENDHFIYHNSAWTAQDMYFRKDYGTSNLYIQDSNTSQINSGMSLNAVIQTTNSSIDAAIRSTIQSSDSVVLGPSTNQNVFVVSSKYLSSSKGLNTTFLSSESVGILNNYKYSSIIASKNVSGATMISAERLFVAGSEDVSVLVGYNSYLSNLFIGASKDVSVTAGETYEGLYQSIISSKDSSMQKCVGVSIIADSGRTAASTNYTLYTNKLDARYIFSGGVELDFSSMGGGGVQSVGTIGYNLFTGGTDINPTIGITDYPIFSSVTSQIIYSNNIINNVDSPIVFSGGNLVSGLNLFYPDTYSLLVSSTILSSNNSGFLSANEYCTLISTYNVTATTSYQSTVIGSYETIANSITNSSIIASNGANAYLTYNSTILGGLSNRLNSVSNSNIIGGDQNTLSGNSLLYRSTIIGGYQNLIKDNGTSTNDNTIIGGYGCTISGGNQVTIIGRSGINVGASNTTYMEYVDVGQFMDLAPLTTQPTAKEGRIFYSAGTGLVIFTGNTSTSAKKLLF